MGSCCNYPKCDLPIKSRGMCQAHYEKRRNVLNSMDRVRYSTEVHHPWKFEAVYAIGCPEIEPVKIGRTRNLWKRLQQMQTGCPYDLRVIAAYFGSYDNTLVLEWEAHALLTEMGFHVRGEWFDIEPSDAEAFLEKCISMHKLHATSIDQYAELREEHRSTGLCYMRDNYEDENFQRALISYRGSRMLGWVDG